MSPRAFRALLVTAILGVVSFSAAFAADSAPVVWTYDPQAPNGPCPSAPACEVWRRFRVSHPWPYQAFGLWEKGADGVVIISEPPPSLSREQLERLLRTVFAGDLVDVTYNRWPTGLDGWLEDVVLRVRLDSTRRSEVVSGRDLLPWQAPAGVVDRLRFIYRILHGITDGFWLDPLGSAKAAREPIAELRVPLSDIAGWLADSKRLWTHASGPAGQMTTRELYVASEPGVYRSGAGVVALVAPRGAKLASLASEFRRFAVASDLIVGGTELKEGGLLLLGRLRQIPLATLPPLRFETFETLAKNRADHLAQSYERQRIFAGRIRTGAHAGWDWAPILLSPQLDDTEFGTLLNLADQALKSWSQHGQVDYYAFGYPKPQKFPFGSLAASDYFRGEFGTTSLLFNWNTEALATITTVNGKEILTGDRTGALPILYRPSDGPDVPPARRALNERRIQEVADGRARDARDYFATLGDPILVRVLQNVLLCQAVQSFLVLSDPQDPPRSSRSDQVAGALEKRAAEWIAEVMKGRTAADREAAAVLTKFMSQSGFDRAKLARVLASPQSLERDQQRLFQRLRAAIRGVNSMALDLAEAGKNGMELFEQTCSTVGGSLQTVGARRRCSWPRSLGESAEVVFSTYLAFSKAFERMQKSFESTKAAIPLLSGELAVLRENYNRAIELASAIAPYTGSVDLDEVLARVLAATSGGARRGSIRTPSVVLSRNSVRVLAIGGHNIDLTPSLRLVAPPVPRKGQPQPPQSPLPLPRPETEALGVRRTGSALEEMRAAAIKADAKLNPNAPLFADLQTRVKSCQCDAVVFQGEDNLVYFVRNAPDPVPEPIPGKSGIVDALAGPPPAKVVRFDNFPDSTVENIAQSAAFMTAGPRGGVLDRALDHFAALFKSSEARERNVAYSIERPGKAPEVLRIVEDSGSIPARQPVAWRASTVSPATPQTWAATFGTEGRLNPATSNSVIVRFGAPARPATSWLGVRVQMDAGSRTGVGQRLTTSIQQWIAAQGLKPKPWAESLIDLRDAIKRQIKPQDLEFYYKRNKDKVRAADAALPDWTASRGFADEL